MKALLPILAILLLSSCFEIIEEVDLKSDGSGSLTYTLNLSQSKTKLNAAMLLDSVQGMRVPKEGEIKSKISEVLAKIEAVEGISDATSTQDFDEYIFTFSCKFQNVDALNKASAELKNAYKVKGAQLDDEHFSFDSTTKEFKRKGDYQSKADPDQIDVEILESLNSAEYTAIYRFEDEVKSVSHSEAKISPNKKATMLKLKAMDVATGKKSIANTIILK